MPRQPEALLEKRRRALVIFEILNTLYPNVSTFLTHGTPFQLLIAVILSAQCTDERVNMVTPDLFAAYPDPERLGFASQEAVKHLIRSINFCNAKADNIIRTAAIIHTQHQDQVPHDLDALIALPGVGRKTANVVRGQAFGYPGITVDTHVRRLANRLGFVTNDDPEKIEFELATIWPDSIWTDFSTKLIVHGRQVCHSRKPNCDGCAIGHTCPMIANLT